MQKIEYGYLYKFLVSVGVILIGFAVLIPYFYLKEDFGLCVPQSDMARFEPEVRQIIRTKQQLLLRVQNYVPYLSLAMLATGLLSVAAGLYKWSRRQRKADAKFDLEVKRLDLQIRALSPEETKEKIAREVDEITRQEPSGAKKPDKPSGPVQAGERARYISEYYDVERAVIESFEKRLSDRKEYEIKPQTEIGDRLHLDMLLLSRDNGLRSDKIIEIKYFRNGLNGKYVFDIVRQMNTCLCRYRGLTGRRAAPVLLIVYNRERDSAESAARFGDRIRSAAEGLPDMEELKKQIENLQNQLQHVRPERTGRAIAGNVPQRVTFSRFSFPGNRAVPVRNKIYENRTKSVSERKRRLSPTSARPRSRPAADRLLRSATREFH